MLLTEPILTLDAWVNAEIVLLQSPWLSQIMMVITSIGNFWPMLALSALVFGFLAYKKRWAQSVFFIITMLAGFVSEILLKTIIQRARPANALFGASEYSLPSGHATMVIIFFGLLIYLFKDDIKNTALRYCFIAGSCILAVLIGFSRIYFNVHWLSDVIAGFCLGLFLLIVLIWAFKKISNRFLHNEVSLQWTQTQ